jgi:hypothetical protein
MKMYYFSRGGYNSEYHLMANSKDEALEFFKTWASNIRIGSNEDFNRAVWVPVYLKEYEYFKNHPEHIEELEEGQVIQTEVS